MSDLLAASVRTRLPTTNEAECSGLSMVSLVSATRLSLACDCAMMATKLSSKMSPVSAEVVCKNLRNTRFGVCLHCVLGPQHLARGRGLYYTVINDVADQIVDKKLGFMIGTLRTRPGASGFCSWVNRSSRLWKYTWTTAISSHR